MGHTHLCSTVKYITDFNGEECADSNLCDLNTDLELTNTSIEMDCATGVHVTRNRGLTCDEWRDTCVCKIDALVSLFNAIINICGLFNSKAILLEGE